MKLVQIFESQDTAVHPSEQTFAKYLYLPLFRDSLMEVDTKIVHISDLPHTINLAQLDTLWKMTTDQEQSPFRAFGYGYRKLNWQDAITLSYERLHGYVPELERNVPDYTLFCSMPWKQYVAEVMERSGIEPDELG